MASRWPPLGLLIVSLLVAAIRADPLPAPGIRVHSRPPPVTFRPTTQRSQVNENAPVGTRIHRLSLDFEEFGPIRPVDSPVQFSIIAATAIDKHGVPLDPLNPRIGIVNGFFAVDMKTGQVIVASKLNREVAAVVQLNVSVSADPGTLGRLPPVSFGQLIITIVDHNDSPPRFGAPWTPEKPELQVDTIEEQPTGTVLMNLLAIDLDSKISHYEINPPSSHFAVDPKTGVVTIKRVLDYEQIVREAQQEQQLDPRAPNRSPNQLIFMVHVFDSGVPQLSATALVRVSVLNVNDHQPRFNQSSYNGSVKENATPGTFVAQVKATDADIGKYGRISYSLASPTASGRQQNSSVGPDQDALARSYFVINNQTGVIRVASGARIDRELGPKQITLQVAASDGAPSPSVAHPAGPADHQTSSYSPSERTQRTVSVPVYITVDDVNDNPPKFAHREFEATTLGHADGTTGTTDNRVPVIQVQAFDPDAGANGAIRYSIKSGNLNGVFDIDADTGLISAIRSPVDVNGPEKIEYKLTVEARDVSGEGPWADEALVRIKIIQVNRHKPKFLFPSQPTVDFFENQAAGTKVLRVQAIDDDQGNNGIVRLAFKVHSKNVLETEEFRIDPESGIITSRISLDREQRSSYELVLVATDYLGEPQQFETLQKLTVIIRDVDDSSPKFERIKNRPETYQFSIFENEPRGSIIGQVRATDLDGDEDNRQIYYHLIDGNQKHHFHLDRKSGVLRSNSSFDREQQDSFELVIKASSQTDIAKYQKDSLSGLEVRDRSFSFEDRSLALLVIRILDINDNEPRYHFASYRAGILDTADIGESVAQVEALDPDYGFNSSITYSIVNTDLFRRGYDMPDSPVQPIPSPFSYEPDGRIISRQLMAQYPIGSRFVLHLESREQAPPHRTAHTKLLIWIYDPKQLIKVTIRQPPDEVNDRRHDIESTMSQATDYRAIVIGIKYHFDAKKNRLVKEWTDLYMLVVDDRTWSDLHPSRVIAKLDSNSHLMRDKPMLIDRIQLALQSDDQSAAYLLQEDLDFASGILIVLVSLMVVGFISMGVACCCLKSWYQQKLIARARKAAAKAKALAIKEREASMSVRDSTLRLSQIARDNENETSSKTAIPKSADRRQQQPSRSPTDNPLWTEASLKFYEEQELSMQVVPNDLMGLVQSNSSNSNSANNSSGDRTPPTISVDNGSVGYATVMETRSKLRQRQPDNDNHEYHELVDTADGPSTAPDHLGFNSKGEPELVTHLM